MIPRARFPFAWPWLSGVTLIAVFGCTNPGPSGEPINFAEIGDTVIATSRRPEVLDTAHMVLLTRFGVADGPEEFMFWTIDRFTVGWRGEVYVADDEGIRVFSPDGSEVRRITRNGQGPGEIRYVKDMEVDRSGRLLVADQGNRRIAVFDTSGVVLDHWPLPPGRPHRGPAELVAIPGGETLVGVNPILTTDGDLPGFPRPIFLRLDQAGSLLDTVFAPVRMGEECPLLDDPYFAAGVWQDKREQWFPKFKANAGPSGEIILGCPQEYVIDRFRPDGSVLRVSHLREPMFESEEARQSFVFWNEWGPGRDWHWRGPRPPEQKPFYHQFYVGRQGRLWVWPPQPREVITETMVAGQNVWQEPTTGAFDVFDADGRFLSPVLLPEGAEFRWFFGSRVPFFSGDTVWCVRADSLGVQYVDKMLIEW